MLVRYFIFSVVMWGKKNKQMETTNKSKYTYVFMAWWSHTSCLKCEECSYLFYCFQWCYDASESISRLTINGELLANSDHVYLWGLCD